MPIFPGRAVQKRLVACFCPLLLLVHGPSCANVKAGELLPRYHIIDTHEHVQSGQVVTTLLAAMDREGIESMALVASPAELFFVNGSNELPFANPEQNNEELLSIVANNPGRFYAFATYSPKDAHALDKFKRFLQRGGTGLKLYAGHYLYHDQLGVPLDAPHLMELYAFSEQRRIPVVFHANARFYWDELKRVLDTYPNLVVNLPHFCMSLIDLQRIQFLFDRYPNVYTDVSLGAAEFADPAFRWVSERRDEYRDFIQRNRERFLYATDMVLTEHPGIDENYLTSMFRAYRDFLEQDQYTNILIEEYLETFGKNQPGLGRVLRGLELDADTLRHIYEDNPRRFLGMNGELTTKE